VIIGNNCNNIYICGDINTKYHQAIVACGDGAKVAMQII
jgi:thioredoxin reductase